MCMEQADATGLSTPAAAASQCYCWVQNSFPWCRKALVLMRGSHEVLYHSTCAPSSPGWGLALCATGQLPSEAVGTARGRAVLM